MNAAAEPGFPEDAVEVGRILGAWGIKGGLRVKAFASDPQALFTTPIWFLRPPEAAPLQTHAVARLTHLSVTQVREQGDAVVVTAQDLDDRNAAEALRGFRVYVARSSFPKPSEGEFYWVDLIGLSVLNREGTALGEVVGLIETGPHCVLRIQAALAGSEECLIPFVDAYVDRVDMPGRCITVDWDLED